MIPIPADASLNARAAMALHDTALGMGDRLDIYRELCALVEDEGPECVFCGQRGLNQGRFAQQDREGRAWYAHIGCEYDEARAHEKDADADGLLAW